MNAKITDLIGKRLKKVEKIEDDEIIFTLKNGKRYKLYHSQSCCESVTIEDISGDLNDLIGSPILKAEESTSDMNPPGVDVGYQDSFTWTFYHFATVNG